MIKKIHYGWLIVVACMLLNAIGVGIFSSILGMFFPSIIETYGYSQASVAGIISIALLSGFLATSVYSKFYQKYSIRYLILIFGLLYGSSYVFMSFASNIVSMYIVAAFIGITSMGATALSVPLLITNWFEDKRGLAMGLSIAGAGLGVAVMAPIITYVLNLGGHQLAFVVLGAITTGSVFVAFALIRNKPSDINLKAYRNSNATKKEQSTDKVTSTNYTLKKAVKTKKFIFLVIYSVIITLVMQGLAIQIPSYLSHVGFASTEIGKVIAGYSLIGFFGRVMIGMVFDKIGVYKSNFIFFGLIILSSVSLIFAGTNPMAIYLYVITCGLSMGHVPIAIPLLVSDFFGQKHYSSIYPIFIMTMLIGAVLGGIITGVIIDMLGYLFFIQAIIVGVLMSFMIIQFTMKLPNGKEQNVNSELKISTT